MNAAVQLAHGAFHLRVAFVANHDELITFFVQLGQLYMHLADQRTSGIENIKAQTLGFVLNGSAHAMGRKHQGSTSRHIGQVFNKNGALVLKVVDHIGVVHNFMAHINRRAEFL